MHLMRRITFSVQVRHGKTGQDKRQILGWDGSQVLNAGQQCSSETKHVTDTLDKAGHRA